MGDPATDFTVQFATIGREAIAAMLRRYQSGGARVWPRMLDHVAEMWSAYPAVVAEFAVLTGEDAHRALGQSLVDATAKELAGRL